MKADSIPLETIARLKDMGFRVYMKSPTDSYAIVTSEGGLCYMQYGRSSGYKLTTTHKPNQSTGTGFQMYDWLNYVKKEQIDASIRTLAPSWAYGERPTKYKDIEDFRKHDQWNAGYTEV